MLRPRIIPCLLIQDGGLVKTTQFKSPVYIGDPINTVKIFNEKGVDEILVLDIEATVNDREPNLQLISQFAVECRMPLCYGGGIRTVEKAKQIVGLGVEKIAISSAAINHPEIIFDIANEIGSQSVVVVLDVKKSRFGKKYDIFTNNGEKKSDRNLFDFVQTCESLGAGEIVVNSIEADGKMTGYDIELALKIRQLVKVPMTILGGAGSLGDMVKLIRACGVVGASAGSFFVFKGPHRAVLISYPNEESKECVFKTALAL